MDMDSVKSENISKCSSYDIPSIPEYLSATNIYGVTLVTMGTCAVILVVVIFVDTLNYVVKYSSSQVKTHTAFVIGVYPVVALATYFAILVPRAHLLAEAITQGMFMAGMYQLFCLFVAYCGGEAELVRKVRPGTLSLKVGPCCCWPCCFFLPSFDVSKNIVRRLRVLVLQLPVVQGLVYLILLVMWAERESLYQVNYMYVQPIIITSILVGVWAMAMTINLLRGFLGDEFLLPLKFLVLQMVLIFAKMQGIGTRGLVWMNILPCRPPITPAVYANLIHNSLMLTEMILLGLVARKLYKRILPDPDNSSKISTLGNIMSSEIFTTDSNSNIYTNNIITNQIGEGKIQVADDATLHDTGHVNYGMDTNE